MGNILKAKDLALIKTRIAELKRDDLPLWGKMNVGEMICHTADQVKMCMGEIKSEDQSTFKTRVIIKNLLLAGMKAPKGKIETLQQINPQEGGSKPLNFDSDREYLLRKLDEFIATDESKLSPHPNFGKMSKHQWGKIIYAHLDHHLNQFGS
jgi:hypothetical protein